MDFIKFGKFCASEDIIKKIFFKEDIIKTMKRQAIDWEKIFANHRSNKELYSEYIKNYDNLIRRRQITQL